MKPSELKTILPALVEEHIPVIVWGPPGIGKSDIVNQVCQEMGIECRDWMRASQMDSVDVRGLPKLNGSPTVQWANPDWWPDDPESKGVLFFDEIGQGAQSVQAALMQVILENRLGMQKLPPGWSIVAASNREGDRSGVQRMLAALSRRFSHITLETDVPDWCNWAIASPKMLAEIVAYIRFRPEALHEFDSKVLVDPNPRAWERASRLVSKQFPPSQELEILQGTVGEGRGIELVGFLQFWRSLPSIDGVLLNPTTAPVPDAPDAKSAIASALAGRATDKNLGAVLTYMERVGVEMLAACVKWMTARDHLLCNTDEFITWSVKYQELFS